MRKIDKSVSTILSKEYYDWATEIESKQGKFPKFRSDHKYHKDVVMGLLSCQKGVCAYTEMNLCDPQFFSTNNWMKDKYSNEKATTIGHVDHFDAVLGKKKPWKWENLFVVLDKINVDKRTKKVDDILKPDSPAYDPNIFLEYDELTHCFCAHSELDDDKKKRVKNMLHVLGINHPTIINKRKKYIRMIRESRDKARSPEIEEYFTACRMVGL